MRTPARCFAQAQTLAGSTSLWYCETVRNLLLFIVLCGGLAPWALAQNAAQPAPAVKPAPVPVPSKELNNDPIGPTSGLRQFPVSARRGVIEGRRPYPYARLNDQEIKLPPGAIIWDPNNRTILHGALPGKADIVFTTDFTGNVNRIWILTYEERRRLEPWER